MLMLWLWSFSLFYFLNYENMITHLQETWKIQNKVTHSSTIYWGFPGSSVVKNPPAMQVTRVWHLGQEDPLEKKMATHSSILDWRIPWTEEPGRLQSMGSQRVRRGSDWTTTTTMYYNYFLSRLRFLIGVSISNSQKLIEWIYRKVEGYSRPEKHQEPIQQH